MNRTGRPSISNSSCRSCYLLVSKGITCIRNSRVQSIPRPVFRFTNGYQKLRRMNFYSPERERERESELRGFVEGIELRRSRRAAFRSGREYKVRFVRDCTRAYFEFRLEFRFVHVRNVLLSSFSKGFRIVSS